MQTELNEAIHALRRALAGRTSWTPNEADPEFAEVVALATRLDSMVRGDVVVTTDASGRCVAITRQKDHRILSVIWEAPEALVAQEPKDRLTR